MSQCPPEPALRQPPSTDCSTCPLQHFQLSFLRVCRSYSLEFTAWQSAQSSCWARPVSTESENQPVCVLLVTVRWRCFHIFALYKCTFTYLLTLSPTPSDVVHVANCYNYVKDSAAAEMKAVHNRVKQKWENCQGILFSGLTLDWFGSLPLCVYWSSLI